MNKLKKIGLTALGTALVTTAATAGELSVSGAAKIEFRGQGNKVNQGNGFAADNTITFAGSTDLDNGMTVSVSHGYLPSTGGADGSSISIDTNGMGALKFETNDAAGPVNGTDDMMPHAYEESWHGLPASSSASPAIGSTGVNAFTYTNSDLLDGLTVTAYYQPSNGATELKSTTEYGVTFTGVEGLTVGYASGTDKGASTEKDSSTAYAKYAVGSFTIGVQSNSTDSTGTDSDFSAAGVSYAVNEDITVSYNTSKRDKEGTNDDQEASAIGISYTNGGITIGAHSATIDNANGTATADHKVYELGFTFAF